MTDYSELVKFLRGLSPWAFPEASNKRMQEAAAAIEALQADMKTYGDTAFKEGYEMGFAAGEARAEKRMGPKRGEWLYNDGDYIPYCSICGMPQDTETPYCHFCGAKMTARGRRERDESTNQGRI